MHKDFVAVQADSPLPNLISQYNQLGSELGFPVVNAEGALQGFLQIKDLERVDQKECVKRLVRDIVPSSFATTFSDEPLRVAADRMAQNDLDSLPVVDPSNKQRVVGLVSRKDLFAARVLWFSEEKNRERVLSFSTLSMKEAIENGRERIRKLRFFSRNKTSRVG